MLLSEDFCQLCFDVLVNIVKEMVALVWEINHFAIRGDEYKGRNAGDGIEVGRRIAILFRFRGLSQLQPWKIMLFESITPSFGIGINRDTDDAQSTFGILLV